MIYTIKCICVHSSTGIFRYGTKPWFCATSVTIWCQINRFTERLDCVESVEGNALARLIFSRMGRDPQAAGLLLANRSPPPSRSGTFRPDVG